VHLIDHGVFATIGGDAKLTTSRPRARAFISSHDS